MFRLAVISSGAVALAQAADANPKDSNAVSKVIEMMEDLGNKVKAEGVAETKAYESYAGWCSNTEGEKDKEIKSNKDTIAELKATIETGEADRDSQIDAISGEGGFEETIANLQKTIADDIESRKKDKKAYDIANKETEKAISGLAKAVASMKASQPAEFLQQQEGRDQLRSAAMLADAMGLGGKDALNALAGPGSSDYDFHSSGIIATLEKLHSDFKDADRAADEEEAKAVNSFTNSQSALKTSLEQNNRNLETAQEAKGAAITKVGQAKKDLEETEDQLAENEKYRGELIHMCDRKKETFDQREATRTEELAALAEATQIMKDATSTKSDGSALLLEVALKAAHTPAVLETAEYDAEIADKGQAPVSFLETDVKKAVRFLRGKGADRRQQAFDLLMKVAKKTNKGRLVAFAQKAEKLSADADVFAEIKRMIADQIDRLKDKAAESQDKKMSCNKRISESSVKRDNANKQVKSLNTKMMESEGRRDELAEDLKRLQHEMDTIAAEVKSASDAREKESTENAADVEEAKIALSGVDAAMKVIKNFYNKNSENSVLPSLSLRQGPTGPAKDAPDATFKNEQAYKGSQGASKGIMGMLEVIQSDFTRSITDIEAAEDAAAKDHTKFLGEADISTSKKHTAHESKNKFHAETVEQLDQETSQLNTQVGILKSAVSELAALDEECGSQISYEERKASREEEIEALQEAVDRINDFIWAQGLR